MKDAGIPIAMYVGRHDRIVQPLTSRWARDKFGPAIVDYLEIDGGHVTFMIGKNQDYFRSNAMSLIRKYNP